MTKNTNTPAPKPLADRLQAARAYRDSCSEILTQRQTSLDSIHSKRASLTDFEALKALRTPLLDAEDGVTVARATLAKADAEVTALETEQAVENRKRDEARRQQLDAEIPAVRERLHAALNEVQRCAVDLQSILVELRYRAVTDHEVLAGLVKRGVVKRGDVAIPTETLLGFDPAAEDERRIRAERLEAEKAIRESLTIEDQETDETARRARLAGLERLANLNDKVDTLRLRSAGKKIDSERRAAIVDRLNATIAERDELAASLA